MLQTVEAEIDVNGIVHLREPLHVTKPTRALVTLLGDVAPEASAGNVADLLKVLSSPEFINRKSYPAGEIDEQINENRESWD